MLKEQAKLFYKLLAALDFFIIFGAIFGNAVYFLSNNDFLSHIISLQERILYALMGALVWTMILKHNGAYYSLRKSSYGKLIWIIFHTASVATLVFEGILFAFKSDLCTQNFILSVYISTFSILLTERLIIFAGMHLVRRRGYNYRQILIVGSGERARRFAHILETHKEWGLKLIGFVDEASRVGWEIDGKKVIGAIDDLETILCENVIDEVVFCMPREWMNKIEKYVMTCEKAGIKAHLALDFFNTMIATPKLSELRNIPLLSLESTPAYSEKLIVKRAMDILISAFFLITFFPLFVIISILIKLTSEGPVFFKQVRCGLNGRKFKMWKFRTMVVDADAQKAKLAALNEVTGPVFKIKKDPRLTKVGGFLRKYSLDEFPQMINVLVGDMSIVGPRPPIPAEVEKYDYWQRRRLSLRPGLTCLWQVSGRNQLSFEDWVLLDLKYIDNWCLKLDFEILFKTVPTVLGGTGL